jgi:hypothetical protein
VWSSASAMSETLDLLEEAALTISHGGAILRLAALQSKTDELLARDLWRRSVAAEEMGDSLKNLFASLRHPSAAGGSARAGGPASAETSP